MRRGLVLGCLLWATTLSAQTIDSYVIRIYVVGASSPLQAETVLAAATVCNQPDPGALSTVNPTRIVWDDGAHPGQVCTFTETAGGVLVSVPVGANYEGTLSAVNAAGASAESARAPFQRLAVPLVPTHVRMVR